jgi:hypothetical protein
MLVRAGAHGERRLEEKFGTIERGVFQRYFLHIPRQFVDVAHLCFTLMLRTLLTRANSPAPVAFPTLEYVS